MKILILLLAAGLSAQAGQTKDNGGDPREAVEFYKKASEEWQAAMKTIGDLLTTHNKFCKTAQKAYADLVLLHDHHKGFLFWPQLLEVKTAVADVCKPNARFAVDSNLTDAKGLPRLAMNDGISLITVNPRRWAEIEESEGGETHLKVVAIHEVLSIQPLNLEKDGVYVISSGIYDKKFFDYVNAQQNQMVTRIEKATQIISTGQAPDKFEDFKIQPTDEKSYHGGFLVPKAKLWDLFNLELISECVPGVKYKYELEVRRSKTSQQWKTGFHDHQGHVVGIFRGKSDEVYSIDFQMVSYLAADPICKRVMVDQ